MGTDFLTYETEGISYMYKLCKDQAVLTGYEGKRGELHIPSMIDEKPVTAIEKKVFFNTSGLYRIYLPDSIESIGDWAFSHCKDLEEVYLKNRSYTFGRAVFGECNSLKRICVLPMGVDEPDEEQLADVRGFGSLLAATCGILDAAYLFKADITDWDEWLSLWDAALFRILHEDDMEGYTKLLLCGEEDYGSKENNIDYFLQEKRKRKVRLAFLRLLYDNGLKEADRDELQQYLLSHTPGAQGDETWLVLKEEHADDTEYINLFFDLGCVSDDNYLGLLTDLSDEHPQLKTYLMRYKEEKLEKTDFFAGLSLDF